MACFTLVPALSSPAVTTMVAGAAVAALLVFSAAPAQAEPVVWDANWGLADAPADIPDANILSNIPSGFTFLSKNGSPYVVGGQTVVRLAGTAAGAAEVSVIGGAGATGADPSSGSEGPITIDTWMLVTGGSYASLVGGSYAQNYRDGEPANFTGDTHILLKSETPGGSVPAVDYIVGGNYMDAQGAVFTGNSYISVVEGVVNGSIVGGGTSGHNNVSSFMGDTHIWIYTPLSGTAANRFNMPGNLVVGGSAGIANATPRLLLEGTTHVNIDFSASAATGGTLPGMEKIIIGDAWLQGGTSSNHVGNAVVSIKGTAQDGSPVSFSLPVVAGAWFAGAGTASISGGTEMEISGGAYADAMVGGAYMAADGEASFSMGAAVMRLNGGSYAGTIMGGSYVAPGSSAATLQGGDISMELVGSTVFGTIYGASLNLRDNAGSVALHGAVSIRLDGGTVLGSVYAGGGVAAGAQGGVVSRSTQVEVSSDVVLGAPAAAIRVSGGVQNANAASGVEGDRVLLLSSESAYSNLGNVTFYDFNVVNNAADATIKLQEVDSRFTKAGTGTLRISGVDSNLNPIAELTVAAGRFDTGTAWLTHDNQGLSAITVGAGASLVCDALTLVDGASLSLDISAATSAPVSVGSAGGLHIGGQKSLSLTLTGLDTLAGGSSTTLLSWGNAEAESPLELSKITLTNTEPGIAAYELSIVGRELVLTHVAELVWDGSERGTWSASSGNWVGQPTAASDGRAVVFNTPPGGASAVSISGEVAPQSITVDNAAGSTYNFEAAAGGAIRGDAKLWKTGGGTLAMTLANTYSGGTELDGGTLDAAVAGALGTGVVQLTSGELLASAANAVSANAVEFNGGSLRYAAAETRNLNTVGITHAAGTIPAVAVEAGQRVSWQYSGAEGTVALQAAMGEGISLSGGGALALVALSADTAAELAGTVSLSGEGTVLELASMGEKQLGSADAPMVLSLGGGTTLRVERPQAEAPSVIHATLSGEGTLEFSNTNAAANSTIWLSGDNSAFSGSINLGSAAAAPASAADSAAVLLDFSSGSPVGGVNSVLNLNGLAFAMVLEGGTEVQVAAQVQVNRSTTQYAQTAGLTTQFSGALSGAPGTVWVLDSTAVDGGQTNTLTGDLSAYAGSLEAVGREGSTARWLLGGEGASSTALAATLAAANEFNEFITDYAQEITLSGAVSGRANLTQQGAGALVLTGASDSRGTLRIAGGSVVKLGNAESAGLWGAASGSTLAGEGTFSLVNGRLAGPLSVAAGSTPLVTVEAAAGQSVDMGGNVGSLITGAVSLGEGSTLTNVGSSILDRELNLTLSVANVGAGTAAATAMVQFADADSPILAARAVAASLGSTTETINIDASADSVVMLLSRHRVAGVESYLTLTNGQLVTAADFSNVLLDGSAGILVSLGLRVDRVEGGSLVLNGEARGVYIAGRGEDPTEAAGYQNFGLYQAVAVMPGETLTLTLEGAPDPVWDGGGATINNLLGAATSALVVNNSNSSGEQARVILNNSVQEIDPMPGGLPGDPTGADTTFGGSISQQGGSVEFVKTGPGMLSVGGAFMAQQLTAQEGTLALYAPGNDLEVLVFEGGVVQFRRGVSRVGVLSDSAAGGTLALAEGASLVAMGESRLRNTLIGGRANGVGSLVVSGTLALADSARLDGVALALDGGTLVLEGSEGNRVSSLNGDGRLEGVGSGEGDSRSPRLAITGEDGHFSGTFAGSGTLTVEAGAGQAFSGGFAGGTGWTLVNNGRMQLDFVGDNGRNAPVALRSLTLGSGSSTGLRLNTDAPMSNALTLGSISVAEGAQLTLNPDGAQAILRGDVSYTIGSVSEGQPAGTLARVVPESGSVVLMLLDAERSTLSVDANGRLMLNLVTSSTNKLESLAGNANSAAAAGLLWNAASAGDASPGTDIRRLLDALCTGAAGADADRILAAASGASAAVLSSAFAADVERQLRAIRNRTMAMEGKACNSCKGQFSAGGAQYGVWAAAEGDHRRMKADGFLPGYSLSSWGGTLGMDMSCSDALMAGLAITAMYGEVQARSADYAEGDFDRCYLSAFARMKNRCWRHTLLAAVGRLDAELDRTVSFGSGSYGTHGSTNGWGYGLMYEIGCDIPMDEDGRFTLQPVANVSWRSVNVDGYTESGSDAGLRVESHRYNTVTFGAGLRARTRVGESLFNRGTLLEGRALVKVDTGDRRAEADVAMLGGGGSLDRVRSATLGAVGVELGAGISIPLGEDVGDFFLDGSAELRNESSNLNGTLGYRIRF